MNRRESQHNWSWGRNPGWLLLLTAPALVSVACNQTPTLRPTDDPYENAQEGFRIKPPSGWTQHAVHNIPSGRVVHERLLTKYRRIANGNAAFLQISLVDLPANQTPEAYLTATGADKIWQPTSKGEKVEVDGVSAVRQAFRGRSDNRPAIKEVVAVQRGQRLYLFTGFVAASDTKARADVRASVASVVWYKGN